MKKSAYYLAFVALFCTQTIVFAGQAINISLNDSSGAPLELQNIRQILGDALNSGLITDVVTYNHEAMQQNQFFACAQATAATTSADFNSFVNQLHAASPQANISYTLKYAKQCNKDNTLVCSEDSASCLDQSLATSEVYGDYVTRGQVAAGLIDISAGKSAMELRLNQGNDVTAPSDIGLPDSNQHCPVIMVSGSAAAGFAVIQCTLSGNASIVGKIITWTRAVDPANVAAYIWTCATDVEIQYAGKCF